MKLCILFLGLVDASLFSRECQEELLAAEEAVKGFHEAHAWLQPLVRTVVHRTTILSPEWFTASLDEIEASLELLREVFGAAGSDNPRGQLEAFADYIIMPEKLTIALVDYFLHESEMAELVPKEQLELHAIAVGEYSRAVTRAAELCRSKSRVTARHRSDYFGACIISLWLLLGIVIVSLLSKAHT